MTGNPDKSNISNFLHNSLFFFPKINPEEKKKETESAQNNAALQTSHVPLPSIEFNYSVALKKEITEDAKNKIIQYQQDHLNTLLGQSLMNSKHDEIILKRNVDEAQGQLNSKRNSSGITKIWAAAMIGASISFAATRYGQEITFNMFIIAFGLMVIGVILYNIKN